MRFKDLGKTILAMVGAVGGAYTVSQTEVVMPVFAQEAQQPEQAALESRIEELMQRPSVEAILAEELHAGTIQRVAYDQRAGRTNFRELVYQESLELGQRLPVLVLFSDSVSSSGSVTAGDNFTKRAAILFKELRGTYHPEEILFMMYSPDIDPQFRVTSDQRARFGNELCDLGISRIPSFAVFSYFDLTRGETPQENEGVIRQIDVLKGAPEADRFIPGVLENISKWWIDQWCLGRNNPDGDRKVYKYENTYQIHEVSIPEVARNALARN